MKIETPYGTTYSVNDFTSSSFLEERWVEKCAARPDIESRKASTLAMSSGAQQTTPFSLCEELIRASLSELGESFSCSLLITISILEFCLLAPPARVPLLRVSTLEVLGEVCSGEGVRDLMTGSSLLKEEGDKASLSVLFGPGKGEL